VPESTEVWTSPEVGYPSALNYMVRSQTEREENMTKQGVVKEEDAGTTTMTFF
jgi:hypothetical protein